MNNTIPTYTTGICRLGWSGNKVHAILITDDRAANTSMCQERNNSTWKTPVAIQKKTATKDNVTCANCLTHLVEA